MPYTDPVPSRINRYRLVLTQYQLLLSFIDKVNSFINAQFSQLDLVCEPFCFQVGSSLMMRYMYCTGWFSQTGFPPLNSEVCRSTEKRDLLHLSSQMLREPVALTKEPSAMSNLWPDMEARMSPRLWTSLNSQNNVKRSSTCTRKGSGHSGLDPSW